MQSSQRGWGDHWRERQGRAGHEAAGTDLSPSVQRAQITSTYRDRDGRGTGVFWVLKDSLWLGSSRHG